MKRRIIRSASSSQPTYPEEYIKLQKSLQDVRHLIEECVDSGLESYANWDQISQDLFSGIQAISKACRASESPIQSSEQVTASQSATRQFIQFDEKFAEIPADAWYSAVRMSTSDYSQLDDEVKDTLGDLGLTRGEDEEGYIYIDVEDRISGGNAAGISILEAAGISKDSKEYEVIQYTEVWS